jgi:hypothetical protein
VAELLAQADSHELTEWQAYYQYLAQPKSDVSTDGRRTVKWQDD